MTIEEKIIYKNALEFAFLKHKGQKRRDGKPYIVHPIAVSEIVKEKGYGLDYCITALFHDLLEDTDALESEILSYSNEHVLKAVKLLTKKKGYIMSEYVAGIKSDKIAYVVKGADRLHNLRSAFSTDEKFRRKYIKETIDWYMDFMPEIPQVVCELQKTLNN